MQKLKTIPNPSDIPEDYESNRSVKKGPIYELKALYKAYQEKISDDVKPLSRKPSQLSVTSVDMSKKKNQPISTASENGKSIEKLADDDLEISKMNEMNRNISISKIAIDDNEKVDNDMDSDYNISEFINNLTSTETTISNSINNVYDDNQELEETISSLLHHKTLFTGNKNTSLLTQTMLSKLTSQDIQDNKSVCSINQTNVSSIIEDINANFSISKVLDSVDISIEGEAGSKSRKSNGIDTSKIQDDNSDIKGHHKQTSEVINDHIIQTDSKQTQKLRDFEDIDDNISVTPLFYNDMVTPNGLHDKDIGTRTLS